MSNSWIRGSRCGVDNCRSKFYRSIDGQRVCQFGHVKEAYMEINDEEDDAGQFVVTRRLTQLNKRKDVERGKSSKVVYGSLGKVVYYQALQHLLKLQVKAMIEHHGAPQALEPVARRIWNDLLKSKRRAPSSTTRSASESDYSGVGSDSDVQGTGDSDSKRPPALINSRYTLATLYVAFRELSLPLFIDDLVHWVSLGSLPYLGAHFILPKGLQQKLTMFYSSRIKGSKLPVRGEICTSVIVLMNCLSSPVTKFNYEPFMFRAMTRMVLPPQIYLTTKKLMKMLNVTLDYSIDTYSRERDSRRFPETKVLATMVTATKLYFAQPYINASKQVCDFNTWKSAFDQLNEPNGQTERGLQNHLTTISHSKDLNRDLLEWDDSVVEKYCDWVTEKISNVKQPDQESISIGFKRLFNILPMPNRNDDTTLTTTDQTQVKKSYEKVLETISESTKPEKPAIDSGEMLRELESTLCEHVSRCYGVELSDFLAVVHTLGIRCGV